MNYKGVEEIKKDFRGYVIDFVTDYFEINGLYNFKFNVDSNSFVFDCEGMLFDIKYLEEELSGFRKLSVPNINIFLRNECYMIKEVFILLSDF